MSGSTAPTATTDRATGAAAPPSTDTAAPFAVHFGGPDRPAGALRDLLAERVAAVPGGGAIRWATYYFRDRELAAELKRAADRGVDVQLVLDGRPRVAGANRRVIAGLRGTGGLGAGLRLITHRGLPAPRGLAWKPQFHEKIYAFSHPRPAAFVGSFNPSGDRPEEDPEVVARIGDHHIAHNALIEVRDREIAECLTRHVERLHRDGSWLFRRHPRTDYAFAAGSVHFWPRRGGHPVERMLAGYGAGARIRIAASHIRNRGTVSLLAGLVRRGAEVSVAAEHTHRRVPPRMEAGLKRAGISVTRFGAERGVPMHLKFVLAEQGERRQVAFGSFNWTLPSRWLNHEVAVITGDPDAWSAFSRRWDELRSSS